MASRRNATDIAFESSPSTGLLVVSATSNPVTEATTYKADRI